MKPAAASSSDQRRAHRAWWGRGLLAALLVLAVACSAVWPVGQATPAARAQTVPTIPVPTSTSTWMRDYGDVIGQRLLKQVVIPGTHDSATSHLDKPAPLPGQRPRL